MPSNFFPAYLRPYLNHNFQNVRDRLGSILINIFEGDLHFQGASEPECPRIGTFIREVVAEIQILHRDLPKGTPMEVDAVDSTANGIIKTTDSEYDQAVRLYKTGTTALSMSPNIPFFYQHLTPNFPFPIYLFA